MRYPARRFAPLAISLGFISLPGLAAAQSTTDHGPGGHRAPHAPVTDTDDEIVVTGHPPVDFGILSATASLAGDKLIAQTRSQIGDTLSSLPGVSATSFAPGASRPVLRGFSGDRVAVLIDGIGSVDASTVSADHAVVFDALSVDHIDIFHGPSVLIFGGNAIGGAVNALDKRIPRRVPDSVSGTVLGGYGSAADERSAGAAVDVPFGSRFVAHFDASWRNSNDLRVGGHVLSSPLRGELLAEAQEHFEEGEADEAHELEELAELKGRIPNSQARSYTVGAGVAFIDTRGDLGISVQRFDTRYGVPLRPGAGHHHEEEDHGGLLDEHDDEHEGEEHGEENVSIDLVQTRVDMRGGLKFDGAVESLQFRGTYGDYEHVELEGDEIGTRFSGKGIEFRADLVQAERNGWRGRSGIQFADRSLEIDGDEAFTPDYETQRLGFYTLQSFKVGSGLTIDGAVRYEMARVRAREVAFARNFDLWSAAAGVSWQAGAGWTLGLNYVHGARAPSPEELLSDGLHVATQSYELGDPTFSKETSDGFEAYLRYAGDRAEFSFTGFLTDFDNFIASVPTGEEMEDFPVYRYVQSQARYYGFEVSGRYEIMAWDDGTVTLDGGADYTHASLKDAGPVPLIPPLRLRGGAEIREGDLRVRGEVEWNDRQKRVAAFASPVPSFALVNLAIDWHPLGEEGPLTFTLDADNIFDVVARRAASVTRDFVPLPGRDIRIIGKFAF